MSKEKEASSSAEQVGYHKGAIATLAKERQELSRILGIVEQLMQLHAAELQKLGVNLSAAQKKDAPKPGRKKQIDDML